MARDKAKPEVVTPAKAFVRNPALEAKLVANPDDVEVRAVFADWLLAQGDRWGEVIALENAHKSSSANSLRGELEADLCGGLPSHAFTWRRGFVDILRLTGKLDSTALAPTFALRTLVLARGLYIARVLDATDVREVSERSPRGLVKLFTWLGNPLAELAHPMVRRLQLYVPKKAKLDHAAFAPLFCGEHTPALRHLEIYDAPLPREWLAALLDSKLLRQLVGLELSQGSLDEAYIIERKAKLAHLEYVNFANQETPALVTAFKAQIRARAKAELDDIV
jgi:uncharacterized protein (TIGR02996 family)